MLNNTQIAQKKVQEELSLSFSCEKLNSLNIQTDPDSYVMVFYKENKGISKWTNIGQTEVRKGKPSPQFTTQIKVEHIFEKQQLLKFEVYHQGSPQNSQLIGTVESTVSNISRRMIEGFRDELINNERKSGILKIRAERLKKCFGNITLKLSASNVPDRHFWFWKGPCPVLMFYRQTGDNTQPILIHQTQYIQNTKNPSWEETINAQQFINGDPFTPITVQLWDYSIVLKNCFGDDDHFFGENSFTIQELQNNKTGKNITKEFKNKNLSFGILTFEKIEYKQSYHLFDYIDSGLELNLLIAIDFTSSNQDINNKDSLHSITNNQYLEAIRQVGVIVVPYDKDKRVSMFGFGCRPKMKNIILKAEEVSHCFNLNDNPADPEVVDLDGIVQCYQNALSQLEFSSPTHFHPVISKAMDLAQQCKDGGSKCYQILMILTDGLANDLYQSIEDIVASSHLPLSIIIIGIGDSCFEDMNLLDNNNLTLANKKGQLAQRDLVTFVEYNKFRDQPNLLSAAVLKELPDQVVQYMELMNILPERPQQQQAQHSKINQTNQQQFTVFSDISDNNIIERKI